MSKILIIEDDKYINDDLKEILELNYYNVSQAFSAEKGLELYNSEKPEMLLVDITLPGMDGFEMISRIRSTDKDVSIFIITADNNPKDILHAFSLSIEDYEIKPFEIEMIIEKINNIFETRRKRNFSRYLRGEMVN